VPAQVRGEDAAVGEGAGGEPGEARAVARDAVQAHHGFAVVIAILVDMKPGHGGTLQAGPVPA
jgi:hypothetical protein